VTRVFTCPEDVLAGEIEFAVTYLAACNPGWPSGLLMPEPLGRRAEFCALVAGMLTERAEAGLSGMTIEDTNRGDVPDGVNRA
jgi:hypothetical protein